MKEFPFHVWEFFLYVNVSSKSQHNAFAVYAFHWFLDDVNSFYLRFFLNKNKIQ